MRSRLLTIVAIVAIIGSISPALAIERPPPVEGYQWAECPEILAAFLRPEGWHFKKVKQSDIWGYFITKENIDTEGSFVTGLTVFVKPNIPEKKGMIPSEYAAAYIQAGMETRKIVKKPWQRTMGPFEAFGVGLLNPDPDGGDFITHNLSIANDTTGTLYTIIFEGPAANWEATWKIGEPMLQRFFIDSDI